MSLIPSFRQKLAPLKKFFDEPKITEIAINKPCEVWLGEQGTRHMRMVEVPELTFGRLGSLAELIAAGSNQSAGEQTPLLSAIIPIDLNEGTEETERGAYRVQIILPPVVQERTIAICIRKPLLLDLNFDMYEKQGAFASINENVDTEAYSDDELAKLFKTKNWKEFLKGIVVSHKNIVVSAGTNAGKTTFLNALLKEIPEHERIVTIEDSREIIPKQKNCLHLIYSRGGQGTSNVTAISLLEASLRLTPDRAIMGELRGAEAYSYLELLNSGHTGSITTIHADSPKLMYERLAQMVMRFGSTLSKEQITDYAKSLIQVVVQLKRDSNGRRYISEILYENAKN